MGGALNTTCLPSIDPQHPGQFHLLRNPVSIISQSVLVENNEENRGDNSIDQTTDDEISEPASTTEHQFTIPNPTNATRKRRLRELHSLVDKVSCINNTMNTASLQSTTDHFAKSVAGQLKAMPLLLALEAQKHIQNYLSDMRIQQLMNSSRTPSPMNNSSRFTPSPSSSTYYVESPEPSQSCIGQNPQRIPADTLDSVSTVTPPYNTVNPRSRRENSITFYSQAGDLSQSILEPDILSHADRSSFYCGGRGAVILFI
ncbi:uncharacterized protein LOC123693001 [Colias croceus]|uniref:uncharacterized protein LOC123693001 n=1 Tax=Colias crocea TaxID=72248 RepID=UPI001E27BD5B|nr:uncharacterized protein LOC123693001 [Colias croceus]